MSEHRYVIRLDGPDGAAETVHRDPREECNTDAIPRARRVTTTDPETVDAVLSTGAVRCQHCWPDTAADHV